MTDSPDINSTRIFRNQERKCDQEVAPEWYKTEPEKQTNEKQKVKGKFP